MRTAYVASSIKNAAWVNRIQVVLEALGFTITYDWTTHGDVTAQGSERCAEVATRELLAVQQADVLVVLLPGGKGTHWECGVASAAGTPIIMISDGVRRTDSVFYFATNVRWLEGVDLTVYPHTEPVQRQALHAALIAAGVL